jgi:cytochrome c oxidase subunit 3
MSTTAIRSKARLPNEQRHHLGGLLFLISLVVFFLSSICLYALYAYWRRDDPQAAEPLPGAFLVSTVCLIGVSGLVHAATRTIRHERRMVTGTLLGISSILAILFLVMQMLSMNQMLAGPTLAEGNGRGLVGMIFVLAFLHALHVAGGIIALGIVAVRALVGKYDHEHHWAVDFAAQYWHFLDLVWLCMLLAFWLTSGGFAFS